MQSQVRRVFTFRNAMICFCMIGMRVMSLYYLNITIIITIKQAPWHLTTNCFHNENNSLLRLESRDHWCSGGEGEDCVPGQVHDGHPQDRPASD